MNSLGKIIRKKRLDMNLTLDQLATLIDSTKSYLSRIENDHIERPGTDLLKRLSKQLNISYNTLIKHSGYMERDKMEMPPQIGIESIINVKNGSVLINGKKLDSKEQDRFIKMIKLFYNLD